MSDEISKERIDELVKAAKKRRRDMRMPIPRRVYRDGTVESDQHYNKVASTGHGMALMKTCSGCGRPMESRAHIEGDVLCRRCQEAMEILERESDDG